MGKSSKSTSIQIDGKWIIACTESIDSHIEFSSSKKQRIQNIPLAYIILNGYFLITSFPSVDVSDFIENEDTFSLAFRCLNKAVSTGFMIHKILSLC